MHFKTLAFMTLTSFGSSCTSENSNFYVTNFILAAFVHLKTYMAITSWTSDGQKVKMCLEIWGARFDSTRNHVNNAVHIEFRLLLSPRCQSRVQAICGPESSTLDGYTRK